MRDISIRSDTVRAVVSEKDYPSILSVAAKLGMKLTVLSRKGAPQLLFRFRRRWGIPVGMLLAALLLSVFSSFVWSVEVVGLNKIDSVAFSDFLRSIHVCPGVFICNIDTNSIESQVEQYDACVKKAEVNLVGSRVFVRVIERSPQPEIVDKGKCCNLIAGRGGEVLTADITAGIKKVRVGDAVAAGDLLAEGVIPLKNEEDFRYVRAQGVVMARTHRLIRCSVPQKLIASVIKSSKTKYAFCFFSCEFPVYRDKTDAGKKTHRTQSVFYLKSGKNQFPLGVKIIGEYQLSETEITPDASQMLLIGATDLALRFAQTLENVNVSSYTETETGEGSLTLETDYVCAENIAKEAFFDQTATKTSND